MLVISRVVEGDKAHLPHYLLTKLNKDERSKLFKRTLTGRDRGRRPSCTTIDSGTQNNSTSAQTASFSDGQAPMKEIRPHQNRLAWQVPVSLDGKR